MDMVELSFKYSSTLFVWYYYNINIPLPAGFHDEYFTKVASGLYKCVIYTKNLNLISQENNLMWCHYKLGHIDAKNI